MAETTKTDSTASKINNTILWITYINLVLYAMCYQLQQPVEPFLIKSLSEASGDGDDSVRKNYGKLQSFFSAVQTIGSPLVGFLLDRIGIRNTSALVFLASATSYAILATAYDLQTLFLSKVPTALQGGFLVAQATAATSTGGNTAARAAALGRMTTAYTVGATLGPTVGGYLADSGDLYIGAKLAVFGSLVSVVLSMMFLPDVAKTTETTESEPKKKGRSFVEELKLSGELALRSALWPLLLVKVLGGVTASMHSTALPLVLTKQLGFEPSQLGLSMSGSMFAVAAFGAFGMAPLTKLLGAPGMTHLGLLGRALLGCISAAIASAASGANALVPITTVSILHALSSHALATGLTTQTTGAVEKQEQGALLGLEHSLFSLARIGGPTFGTTLLGVGSGLWLVEAACGSLDLFLIACLIATSSKDKRKSS